jgi:hypothetical protein
MSQVERETNPRCPPSAIDDAVDLATTLLQLESGGRYAWALETVLAGLASARAELQRCAPVVKAAIALCDAPNSDQKQSAVRALNVSVEHYVENK